jgi:Flp pilus assembly protein TadG
MNRNSRRSSQGPPRRGDRLGVAATEFAIVAPLMFMLVIGFIEVGRGLMVQQVLTNASRVGAREAITIGATQQSVSDTATDYASGASVGSISVVCTPSPTAAAAGDTMTVTVSVDYADVSWIPAPWFMGNTTLTASSVMRKEGF